MSTGVPGVRWGYVGGEVGVQRGCVGNSCLGAQATGSQKTPRPAPSARKAMRRTAWLRLRLLTVSRSRNFASMPRSPGSGSSTRRGQSCSSRASSRRRWLGASWRKRLTSSPRNHSSRAAASQCGTAAAGAASSGASGPPCPGAPAGWDFSAARESRHRDRSARGGAPRPRARRAGGRARGAGTPRRGRRRRGRGRPPQ